MTSEPLEDDISMAYARGAAEKRNWLAQLGGAYTPTELARLRNVDLPEIEQLRLDGTLFAVPLADGSWGYPKAMYNELGELVDGAAELLAAMNVENPWMRVQELVVPMPDTGESVLAALKRLGRDALPLLTRRVSLTG